MNGEKKEIKGEGKEVGVATDWGRNIKDEMEEN